MEKTKADILDAVRKADPSINISVTWEQDPSFVWDGDGPDPVEDGFAAYDVTVTATKIIDGEMYEGHEYLGGSYSPYGGPHCPLVHGYLAQMVDDAIEDLMQETAVVS